MEDGKVLCSPCVLFSFVSISRLTDVGSICELLPLVGKRAEMPMVTTREILPTYPDIFEDVGPFDDISLVDGISCNVSIQKK